MMALAAIGHFDPASWQTSHADPIVVLYTDISRAYFNAPVKSDKYVVIPDEDMEDGDIGKYGKPNSSLYGTREAATNWEKHYSEWMESQSFTRGKATSCAFYSRPRRLRSIVHGDDFVAIGPMSEIMKFKRDIEKKYETRSTLFGPKEIKGCQQE